MIVFCLRKVLSEKDDRDYQWPCQLYIEQAKIYQDQNAVCVPEIIYIIFNNGSNFLLPSARLVSVAFHQPCRGTIDQIWPPVKRYTRLKINKKYYCKKSILGVEKSFAIFLIYPTYLRTLLRQFVEQDDGCKWWANFYFHK